MDEIELIKKAIEKYEEERYTLQVLLVALKSQLKMLEIQNEVLK